VMWNDHTPEPYRKTVHLDQDLANRAIEWITGHKSIKPDLPFMMLWASGSMHSPHHAPDSHIDRYKGKFDMGWDKAREAIIARQIELGIIPAATVLSERAEKIPAWDSLPADERRLYARQMEVFAAQMEWVDMQIGRVVDELERIGELDNTLIFVTADNGASGEGGLAGTFNETYVLNGLQTPLEANLGQLEDWGRENTYPHYHAGWAMAGNTPFKYFKQTEHRGGQQDHLVVHWPSGIKSKGEIRNQYHHISDIAPTILEAAGVAVPETYHGVKQQPMDGVSMMYAFDDADAPNRKQRQYYEMFGNRAIWAEGWKAVVLHGNRMPWELAATFPFDTDEWELYHVAEDFSESRDLAAEHPEKLKELIAIFDEEARQEWLLPDRAVLVPEASLVPLPDLRGDPLDDDRSSRVSGDLGAQDAYRPFIVHREVCHGLYEIEEPGLPLGQALRFGFDPGSLAPFEQEFANPVERFLSGACGGGSRLLQ